MTEPDDEPDERGPLQRCPFCKGHFHAEPYDIGSGPELACPHCEMCWGANGQPLKPLPPVSLEEIRNWHHGGRP
jgi:hypothetical protein